MRATSVVVLLTSVLLLVSCVSPGEPYTYLDIKFAVLPTLTPLQPATNQPVTVAFSIRNTWNQDLNGVPYIVYQNTDPGVPTSGTVVVPSTLVDIPAFGSVPVTFIVPAQAPGNYTYSVVLDQAQLFAERDFTDNTATFTVTFADQDIAFDAITVPSVTDPSPSATPTSDPLLLTFALDDIVNYAQTAPQDVSVTYQVVLNGVVVAGPLVKLVSPTTTTEPVGSTTIPPILGLPTQVSVALPATGATGTFIYTIQLSTQNGFDSNLNNNTAEASFTILTPN
jgi:hypothetical protein